ncbi:hypothetical protein ACGF0D_34885 [Kitasatospora sp. NPDC048298]|uniref:hypothetical protein n=1 Tax=Kitasatospora sp. NPDC048298 TaxID=3364049 RepID=UPI003719FC5F
MAWEPDGVRPAEQATGAVELPESSWWDGDGRSWRPGELRLAVGSDLCYHHGLEPVFADPLYVRCPASFQDSVFRPPTPEERRLVERQCGEEVGALVAFEADDGGAEPVSRLIAAVSLELRVGTVLRYRPAGFSAGPSAASSAASSAGGRPGRDVRRPDGTLTAMMRACVPSKS